MSVVLSAIAGLLLAGYVGATSAPALAAASPDPVSDRLPRLAADRAWMDDGYRLPLRTWGADRAEPRVAVLGLHGFNDHGQSFAPLAAALPAGVRLLTVDQRGFGAAAGSGRWHGGERLAADLATLTRLLRARHPRARLIVAGESMGGAVAMLAAVRHGLPADGLILIAPAVWSRDTMPWYQRLALDLTVRLWPEWRLTGRGVRLRPSDHREMLRAMSADPLVIKATRVDALWGIVNLMDAAQAAAPRLTGRPVLLLYGARDEIIPPRAFCRMLATLPADPARRLVLYRNGWHMLTRDLQGARVRADIAAWLQDPRAPLPSGEETPLDGPRVGELCAGTRRIRSGAFASPPPQPPESLPELR